MKQRLLYYLVGIPVGLLAFLLLTLFFTPNDAIRGVIVRAAENAGYTVAFTGFGKAFPVGIKADSVEISSDKGSLLKLRRARVRLEILPLLTGKAVFAYHAGIGAGGELSGEASAGRSQGWNLKGKGIRLEDVPFFSSVAEAKVRGELKLDGQVKMVNHAPEGDIKLEVQGAELGGVKIGAMPLPDASYRQVRGALGISKGKADLKSFTLEGDGIYVRLKGSSVLSNPIANSPLDLTLEMMPKPEFLERQKFVFLLLVKYQTSPGAYSIPIRGTLGHPSI
ncbi:type II secretion system protein GspN [Geomonas sp. Red276]